MTRFADLPAWDALTLQPRGPARLWLCVALVSVGAEECHWPMGEIDDTETFHFCRAVLAQRYAGDRRPRYCAEHMQRAYLKRGETQEQRDASDAVLAHVTIP